MVGRLQASEFTRPNRQMSIVNGMEIVVKEYLNFVTSDQKLDITGNLPGH